MRQKNVKKKTVSLLLAAAMILTSFPVSGKEARAAGTSDRSLSVEAFATKEQLMSAFAPDGNGSSSATGKIAFGKNSTSAVQEWYILGKDNGVTGDNTVLFAAGPIATNQKFDENYNISDETTATKSYNTEWGCAYTGNAPTEVNANHYGGSGVRAKLKEIAGSAQYFTTAEQGLMNGTTVTTHDAKADADYTTTDKLYALTAENSGSSYRTIKAGTNDQIVLAMSTYWSSGSRFWLRAPNSNFSHFARVAVPGSYVYDINVNLGYALVPAFDLNLSSVIFASAAKAASSKNAEAGTIANGTAMTLRLDGSDKTIGTVVYDDAAGKITAQKDAGAAGTVSLVVQGNDGTKDWYYSVQAGEATVVTKEQIQNACGISGDISLADCKIWLETTIDNVAYARMAVAATSVTITGSDQTLIYDVSAIDVSKYFSIDKNAGTPTYSLVTESGVTTGTGNLSGKELTVTKIGVFKVKLTTAAQGIYAAGEKTITLTITGKTLTDSMITIADGPHYYTGDAATPDVTVKDGSKTLVSGTDYTVSYENNTNVGTATVTVAGKGNYTGTIEKTFEIILTDADKVAAAKEVVEDTLADYTATNGTTKQEIQDKIDTVLTNAGISDVTVTVGDIVKTEATTSVAGSISGSISITKGSASDSVTVNKTIEKLPKTEAEKVADAKKVVEETLAGITASNSTTKQEIQDEIDTALTQAGITEVTVTVGELEKIEATTEAAGSIGGNISIVSKKDSGETDSVSIIKTIEKLPKTEAEKVADAKKVVEETLAEITATNSTTKQEIQEKIDTALTQAGITEVTVTVGDLTKVDATTEAAGSISGNISIISKNDLGETESVPIIKTIENLPKTEAEKVTDAKKVVEETLEGITASNSTTKQEIQEKIDTALTKAGITEVTVTVGDLEKTEATTEAAGSISGNISIISKNDRGETESVPIIKTIEKLPKTEAEKVADAKKVVEETLAGITATNSTTKQEIQEKIDEALTQAGITEVTVTVGDLEKTDATTEAAGSIGGNISIVSKNDSGETDSVPIIKTIEKLPKTEAEKVADAKKVVEETLAGITATNGMTKQEIQDKIDEALTQAGITEVTVTVGELEKTEATTEAAGSIGGNISIESKNDAGETGSVPIIKTIEKLPKTEAEKVANAKKVVEDVLEEVLAGITTASEVTSEDIQREIDEALTNAGIIDVTVTVGELDRTEATTDTAGSISGSITLVSDNDSDVIDSVPIHKTIAQLHTHSYTWIITKEATADEEGQMTGTCICGEVTTETIPKTGESGSGTVIVKEDAENECNGSLEDKEDVKGKVSLTDTEKEQLNTGEDLVIILRLRDVDVAVDTQEKTEIQDKLETNTLGTFLDIELLKQIGGTETKITETTDEIEITFEIPEHIRNTDDTVTRTYQIMRHHDGVVDILDVENYDEAAHLLTFKTDKFSTYALVYRDAAKNPTITPGPTETPGTPSPTPGTTDTPGTPTATPVTTDTPGTPSPTPITTETPDTSTPTPVPTNTPGIPTATPVTTETPGTSTATPEPTDTPGTPLPTPGTTATPGIVLTKDALSLNALLKVTQTGKKINIAWGKVAGADGYDVYVQYCGKEFTKKSITAIKSGKTTKVTVKKVNGKALNQKKIYKIYVLAYKLVDGKKVTLAKTITAHIAGKKNAKYTNVKVVKVRKSSYSLKQGKTAVIKASTVLESKGKKQLSNAHAKEFRYATDNKEVATVSKKGKIKAVGKGSCTIYVYARNGCAKKIKVKVK